MTPDLVSVPGKDDTCAVISHTQTSKHSHYSKIVDKAGFLPAAPTPGCLHQLLKLNEPSRAITWAKAAYHPAENHTVLQVSLCHHYRSTFVTYGALISPLILLKAIKSAFPSVITHKTLGDEPEYVVKGIQLKEGLFEFLHMANIETTAFSPLRGIQFDAESVSLDILEGMETPTWRVLEDSQATSSLNARSSVALNEDCESLESSMIEQTS
jgi:hypothetical protein